MDDFYAKIKRSNVLAYCALTVMAIYTLSPIFLLVINSFKSHQEIVSNPLAMPENFTFEFITNAMYQINFFEAFFITLTLTVVSVSIIVIVSSLAAWVLVRNKSKLSSIIFFTLTSAMLIPFQAIMFPLISFMETLGLRNLPGLVVMYAGFGVSMSVFLYHGFIKTIPQEIEEAAIIDGANPIQLFFGIVFPLLQSITVTIVILNTMWVWNDYLLPFLVIGNSSTRTLTLELFYARMLAGQFGNPWELIFPAVTVSVIPIIILFLILQKHIVKGIAAGAVKG